MATFEQIAKLSPLPIVNLDDIRLPQDGLFTPTPAECAAHFAAGDACRTHYLSLPKASLHGYIVQCPFGFATCVVKTSSVSVALTGIVPYPRLGGKKEQAAAKRNPSAKLATANLTRIASSLREGVAQCDSLEVESLRRQSVALHEIRKLNRTIKQTAERLCLEDNPLQPDAASPELVQIWKSSELMSAQFEVIELLANEELLATLPLNTTSNLYRICDKCARIYNPPGKARILLQAAAGYIGLIRACDKTLPIIPTALFDNALKYSLPMTSITARLSTENGYCVLRVSNDTTANDQLTDRAFEKGIRFSTDHDGTGNGLHLVRRVAEQHNGTVSLSTIPIRKGVARITVTVAIPEYIGPATVTAQRPSR